MQYRRLWKLELQLMSHRSRRKRRSSSLRKFLFLGFLDALDMLHKVLSCDLFLVVLLELIPLVVKRFVKVFGVDLTPSFIPLSLYATPLLILGLQACEHDRDCDAGTILQGLNDFGTGVTSIDLLQGTVIDAPAGPTKVGFEPKRRTLFVGHLFDARAEWLKERDGACKGLQLDVIFVSFFFALVKRFFKRVLLMGNETGLF